MSESTQNIGNKQTNKQTTRKTKQTNTNNTKTKQPTKKHLKTYTIQQTQKYVFEIDIQ